jgi:hypothetical protein
VNPRPPSLVISSIVAVVVLGFGVYLAADVAISVFDGNFPYQSERQSCSEYSFDAEAWEDWATIDDEARNVVRCRILIGMTRREVVDLIGRRVRGWRHARRWELSAGAVNDYAGPGDAQALYVRFGADDRVQGTRLRHGGKVDGPD